MKILGIDPGLDGGLVMVDGEGNVLAKHVMPVTAKPKSKSKAKSKGKGKRSPDLQALVTLLEDLAPDHTYLEKVSARPGNGNVSMFNFGFGFGALAMGLEALKLPFTYILPQTWCKVMHQTLSEEIRKDKDIEAKQKSLMVFKELYPDMELRTPRQHITTVHAGMMDALLIAEYGRRDLESVI
jgi:hypothetical protein